MIFELLFPIITTMVVDRLNMVQYKHKYDSNPRFWYKITRGWWKGAFSPETTSMSIANMIDSDRSCELWNINHSYNNTSISSKSLGVIVLFPEYENASVSIIVNDQNVIHPDVSIHDDYLLKKSFDDFNRRRNFLEKIRRENESITVLNEKTSKNYVDTIEMVEKRILDREPETANELRSILDLSNKIKKTC